jgi:probable H4MPT-linked C1 transfer pathway protein
MSWLGLDIGGAHIKLATADRFALTHQLPLWRDKSKLVIVLRRLLAEAPPADHVVVTMTGELADCFPSRREGVEHIVQSVVAAAAGRHVRFYRLDGRLVAATVATQQYELVASANWHALGTFAARWIPENGMLIDIGSTTTDVLPISKGNLLHQGHNDTQRLIHGELVYTGVERSSIAGIVRDVPYRGADCPVMNELFATSGDVYLLTDDLSENSTNRKTADQAPATKPAARTRLSRLIGATDEEFNHRDAAIIAEHVRNAQVQLIADAVRRVAERLPGPASDIIISGQGEFLATLVIKSANLDGQRNIISMAKRSGRGVSRAAPAYALAVLAQEMEQP